MAEEKLIYLMNHYSPLGTSHFSHVLALLDEMARQGTQVLLIVERAEIPPEMNNERIKVHCFPTGLRASQRWLLLVRTVSQARRDGYRTAFVRISTWSALAAIVAFWGNRGKVFYWLSGTTIEFNRAQPWGWNRLKSTLRSSLPSWLVWRLCDRFVTGPASMADYYANMGGINRRKIRVLYNDVDHRRFVCDQTKKTASRRILRQRLGVPETTTLILFVHRLSPVRFTLRYLPLAMELVRSADMIEDVCLVIVGGGPDLLKLQNKCENAGLHDHIRFLGDKSNVGIEEFYFAADLFVQPTHAEGFPRVLVEAMVAGLPVVTTDAGGSREILGPLQQAFVTPKDRPREFGIALVAMLQDRSSWETLSRENRRTATLYDTPPVATMYREVLFCE